ncbi:hypothetical protein RRG08_038123 [Elysia crispata]|uniref:Uncharacterized protein n=1 Tax=Elysia crispata TaxID=231223 RepID=A0AAE0ZZ14_9GAST|nr:hypothetical protein RRG08_038123 [Elysia crispata]
MGDVHCVSVRSAEAIIPEQAWQALSILAAARDKLSSKYWHLKNFAKLPNHRRVAILHSTHALSGGGSSPEALTSSTGRPAELMVRTSQIHITLFIYDDQAVLELCKWGNFA